MTIRAVFHRRLLAVAAGLWLLMAGGSSAAADSLELVTEAWPPLVDESDGQPGGPLWRVTDAVLERMGYDSHLAFVPWKRALDLVARNRADAVLGAGKTAERVRLFQYPDEPLALSETTLFSNRNAPIEFTDFHDLAGKTIALSAGYSYAPEIWSAAGVKREEVRDVRSGLQMVALGRVDAFVANRQVGWFEANRLGLAGVLTASEKPISAGPVYLMFSPETPAAFVQAFDQALSAFRKTADYRRLMTDFSSPEAE
ncbi:substrate-binding periplasmic protein [Marinobacter halodurans]|nr:transporter substrate-binding domain-containing protein [Marinobacter halodurans]